ncbi:phosphatase PAP2 family protein [Candidatus Enterococcus ikei]|uniref:Phosphatase PAP2 family protein n=1 Tax=Candidatus Enterococcus ikei TaxID=2815326 RepID=A0ABS3GZX1_9ENTE|nr:phosphatase PAP2 family protein [Enterococcus sp. DIV0869a]MBO0440790.1 phosphatase PAP2 family protein [Enterococcus sp. DIV0869a]
MLKKMSDSRRITMVISIFVVLLGIGTFGDLAISNAVMSQNSYIATFLQNYACFPVGVVIMMSGEIIIHYTIRSSQPAIAKLLIIVAGTGLSLYGIWYYLKFAIQYTLSSIQNVEHGRPIGQANNDGGVNPTLPSYINIIVCIVVFAIATLIIQSWLSRKTNEEMERLMRVAILGVAVAFVYLMCVEEIKILWGRVRPYELNAIQDNFTPWYKMNGPTGHKSFPSGHSCESMFALFFPLYASPKRVKLRKKLLIFGVSWGAITAISRVLLGCHFFSDATMGAFIIIFLIFVGTRCAQLKLIK